MWLLIVVVCAIHIWSIDRSNKWLFYTTKATPVLLMSAIVFTQPDPLDFYTIAVGVALLLSSVGDLYLMHPKDKFLQGLSLFLLAHIAYSAAFIHQVVVISNYWVLLSLAATAVIIYLLLLPGLGRSKIPVAIYSVAIVIMAWGAVEFWTQAKIPAAGYAMLGALTFVVSDIVLAVDRFRSSSGFSRHVVMVTYYTAQGLLALSAVT